MEELDKRQKIFVDEYIRSYDPSLAARKAGYLPHAWQILFEDETVQKAISEAQINIIEDQKIDADWVLYQLMENHRIARINCSMAASNKALELIMRHTSVDAFAANKQDVSISDAEQMDRLNAGRARLAAALESLGEESLDNEDPVA